MKLRFRGQVYSQFPKRISTVLLEATAFYRGHKHSLRDWVATDRSLVPNYQLSAVIYKYRGNSYMVEHRLPDPAAERYMAPHYQTSAAIYKYRGISYVVEHHQ